MVRDEVTYEQAIKAATLNLSGDSVPHGGECEYFRAMVELIAEMFPIYMVGTEERCYTIANDIRDIWPTVHPNTPLSDTYELLVFGHWGVLPKKEA